MDLKAYYRKIRETERELGESSVVVVSEATPDGGRAGVRTEVPRGVAARLMVDGRARLASAEEAQEFRAQAAEAQRMAAEELAARQMQVTLVSAPAARNRKS